MSDQWFDQWFVRQKSQEYGPIPFEPFALLVATGKLAASALVNAPGNFDWEKAGTIYDLFGQKNASRFSIASKKMKDRCRSAVQDAAVDLTEIVEDQRSSTRAKQLALWRRGHCQKRMAWNTESFNEVIALYESAQRDFLLSVKTDPAWYTSPMKAKCWFPQHPIYLPAYDYLLTSSSPDGRDRHSIFSASSALVMMGREAAEILPALTLASKRAEFLSDYIETNIQRISRSMKENDSDELQRIRVCVEQGLQIYPGNSDRFDDENNVTDEELARPEAELVSLLSDKNWAVRAKTACIIRCKLDNPRPETIRALFEHLDPKEKQGNVRGQCALGLACFASNGAIKGEMLDRLINVFRERLDEDSAYSVKAIAAEALSEIGPGLPEVVDSLVTALAKPKLNLNLQRALIGALGNCGSNASKALPLVLRFTPHGNDETGEVVKAVAILQIAAVDHPEAQKSLKTIQTNLGWQPIATPTTIPRFCREAAFKAVLLVPMDETLRTKLLLERMFFEESARLRRSAAQAVINIDKDLATKSGAYLIVDRIWCR
jgi:hypothetical protein